jgi:hypothetical protein
VRNDVHKSVINYTQSEGRKLRRNVIYRKTDRGLKKSGHVLQRNKIKRNVNMRMGRKS